MQLMFQRRNIQHNSSYANANSIGGGGGQQRDESNTTTAVIEEEWDGSTIHSFDNNNGLILVPSSIENFENEGNYRGNHPHHPHTHNQFRNHSFNNFNNADGGGQQMAAAAAGSKARSSLRKRTHRSHSTSSILSVSSSTSSSKKILPFFKLPSHQQQQQQQLHLSLPKISSLHRKPKREVQIAEARHRAALRLQPPPFASDSLVRLHELKEAKEKLSCWSSEQQQQQQQHKQQCRSSSSRSSGAPEEEQWSRSSSGDGNSIVVDNGKKLAAAASSSNSLASNNPTSTILLSSQPCSNNSFKEQQRQVQVVRGECGSNAINTNTTNHHRRRTSKMTSLARRHCLIFSMATLLHAAMAWLGPLLLLPLPSIFSFLLRMALQSFALRYLLTSCILYSFDNIDFGQLLLVRNMNHVKQMVIAKVQYYSNGIALGVFGMSLGLAWLLSLLGGDNAFVEVEEEDGQQQQQQQQQQGYITRAYDISIFLHTRLGVFVLAALLLGHIFLPPPKIRKSEGNNANTSKMMKVVEEEEEDEKEENDEGEHEDRGMERNLPIGERIGGGRRRGNTKSMGGALSWSVTFVLAIAVTVATATSPNYSSPPPASSLSSPITPNFQDTTKKEKTVQSSSILVAGSLNADTFLPVHRFPSPGENLTLVRNQHPMVDVPGGKGCNQAVACAKLLSPSQHQGTKVSFLGQFGNDSASVMLRDALVNNDVDVSPSGQSKLYPSGRGYVLIVPETGEVSAVVSGGSNLYGWEHWGVVATDVNGDEDDEHPTSVGDSNTHILSDQDIGDILSSHSLLLLQCEIPSLVNHRLARAACNMNIPVLLDVGGEDRIMERELLECCDYLIPNETELERLAKSYQDDFEEDSESGSLSGMSRQEMDGIQAQLGSKLNIYSVVKSIRILQKNGANNVLVTLGSQGSFLMRKENQKISQALPSRRPFLYRPACTLPAESTVVDETGAGDCYRAGFAVALLEQCLGVADDDIGDTELEECMKFASAAGALAVTRKGAVPSIPSRMEVEELLASEIVKGAHELDELMLSPSKGVPRGGGGQNDDDNDDFPFLFGSRINSMKDRLDLVDHSMLPLSTPRDYLRRMATIRGLGCVDFNFPQHFEGYWTPEEARKALDEVNLVAGAVCLRYPSKFARGAMNHPDAGMRREAVEITKQAAEAARILGCNEVVVWSAYDGYDYPFQVSYKEKWNQIVQAFQECCDAYPDIKWSLEFKPTDENTRFFTVPSTGAAMLLVNEIDRPNMGLTLDMGHMLMAGENPGQSIAMVGEKLFGIQLNDGYTRLAAEDGMMFGSIHPSIALETMYQLRQINFSGHLYFDTFPQRTDPVKEAEYNIRRVKAFWSAVTKLDATEVKRIACAHDAIGALELVNEALKR